MSATEKLPDQLFANPVQQRAPRPESQGSPFQKASMTLSRIKAGFFGEQGCGKTTTALLIALGLSKTFHGGAPIFMHDTEAGSDFLVDICALEGVDLFTRKSRSFRDMTSGLQQAAREGACVYIEDSISSDWNELMESFKRDKNIKKIELYHWGQIKPRWNDEWVVPMLNSPLHVLTCGRQGDKWEDVVEEDGDSKAKKVGVKMKAEGEFGYEPFLLLWMQAEQKLQGRKRGGSFVHKATVLKDKSRRIQGLEFEWPDINRYKKGDWKAVFDKIKPHVDFFSIASEKPHAALSPDGRDVIFTDNGNSDYYERKRTRTIALEEIEGTITAIWPGQDAKSKKFKAMAVHAIFGTRSWTYVTEKIEQADLDAGLVKLRVIESRTKNTTLDEEDVVTQVLNEAMGKATMAADVNTAA
jgi:hypothetical protein